MITECWNCHEKGFIYKRGIVTCKHCGQLQEYRQRRIGDLHYYGESQYRPRDYEN